MKKAVLWTVVILLTAALAIVLYRQWQEQPSRREAATTAAATPPGPAVTPQAPIRYQAPESTPQAPEATPPAPPTEPLPPLNRSDETLTDALLDTLGREARQLLNLDGIARRFVVTVDNLPNQKLPKRQNLFRPVAGRFLTAGPDDNSTLSPDNATRYTPYVKLATQIDTARLVAVYERFYPLFQQAYVELGYPDASFHKRLLAVIDHLLSTPAVQEPVRLVRPRVFYQYADPKLEALSAGQKILIRMGNTNAEAVKMKLRELRSALAQKNEGSQGR